MAYLGFINTCRLSGGGALHAAKEALCRLANGFAWYWCDVCQHEIVPCTNLFNNPLPHTHTHRKTERGSSPLNLDQCLLLLHQSRSSPHTFVQFSLCKYHCVHASVLQCDILTRDDFLFSQMNTSAKLSWKPQKSNNGKFSSPQFSWRSADSSVDLGQAESWWKCWWNPFEKPRTDSKVHSGQSEEEAESSL